MRILIASCHRALVGGLETYLNALLPELHLRGHSVSFSYQIDTDLARVDSGQSVFHLTLDAIREWQPDVIYVHEPLPESLAETVFESWPVVLYAHNYYGTCATGRKSYSCPDIRPCSRALSAACLALHYPRRCGGLNPLTAIRGYRQQKRWNRSLQRYRGVLVASEHMRQEYLRHGVSPQRLHLLHLPVAGPQHSDGMSDTCSGAALRILFVSRLTDLKGGNHLLQAVRGAEDRLGFPLELVIAGSGPEEMRLRQQARELQVRVIFAGWIQHDALEATLRNTDLLVVPSLWPEPFGLVGVEAARCGVPAVAYDVGGIREWLIDGVTGVLAPGNPPTPEGLASAIIRVLENRTLLGRMRTAACEHSKRFTMHQHLLNLERILTDAVS